MGVRLLRVSRAILGVLDLHLSLGQQYISTDMLLGLFDTFRRLGGYVKTLYNRLYRDVLVDEVMSILILHCTKWCTEFFDYFQQTRFDFL